MFCLTPHHEEAVDLRQDDVRVDRELSLEALVQIGYRGGPLPPVCDVVVSVVAAVSLPALVATPLV